MAKTTYVTKRTTTVSQNVTSKTPAKKETRVKNNVTRANYEIINYDDADIMLFDAILPKTVALQLKALCDLHNSTK